MSNEAFWRKQYDLSRESSVKSAKRIVDLQQTLVKMVASYHEVEHTAGEGTALPYGWEDCQQGWCYHVKELLYGRM